MSDQSTAPAPQDDPSLPDEAAGAVTLSFQPAASAVIPDEPPQAQNGGYSPLADLALTLFDRTQMLHELDQGSREVLDLAAHLASKPIPRTRKKPFKAARAHVAARVEPGMSPEDQATLAAVLAFHQGRLKRKELSDLEFDDAQLQRVLTLAAVLRMAAALNRGDRQPAVISRVRLDRDELLVVVDGPQAEAAAADARHAARLWRKLGYPRLLILAADAAAVHLAPFPEPTERIGLLAADALSEAGRKVMCFQFARMLAVEEEARRGEDIEGVHDMRVATRRLRAAFEVFEAAYDRRALKPFRDDLRRAGRTLGKVRDLDVLLQNLRQYTAGLPEDRRAGLDPLRQAWKARREQARIELLEYLDSKDYAEFKHRFKIFILTPWAGASATPGELPQPYRLRDLAPILIYQRMAAVRAYASLLENAPPERLHQLRIEFKKLRYTVEYFQEALGSRAGVVIDTVKQLQDHLGELNDAEVACGLVDGFLQEMEAKHGERSLEPHSGPDEIAQYLTYRCRMREQLIATFPEIWQRLMMKSLFRRSMAQAVSVL